GPWAGRWRARTPSGPLPVAGVAGAHRGRPWAGGRVGRRAAPPAPGRPPARGRWRRRGGGRVRGSGRRGEGSTTLACSPLNKILSGAVSSTQLRAIVAQPLRGWQAQFPTVTDERAHPAVWQRAGGVVLAGRRGRGTSLTR